MIIRSLIIGILVMNYCPTTGQQVILKSESTNSTSLGLSSTNVAEENKDKSKRSFEPTMFKSLDNSIIEMDHEVVMVGKIAPADVNIYEISLFGGYQKSLQQIEEDKSFLENCDKNFENREKASRFFSDMGWQYLSEGSKEMATYRYNLAYLLDAQNTDVFWGLGVIEYQKGDHKEAIKLMSMGLEADDNNAPLLTDLATVYIHCYDLNHHKVDLPKAYQLLDKALKIEPTYVNAYMQLAHANLIDNKIDEAWMSFHKGYEINPMGINFDLLGGLLSKKADPLGLFK